MAATRGNGVASVCVSVWPVKCRDCLAANLHAVAVTLGTLCLASTPVDVRALAWFLGLQSQGEFCMQQRHPRVLRCLLRFLLMQMKRMHASGSGWPSGMNQVKRGLQSSMFPIPHKQHRI